MSSEFPEGVLEAFARHESYENGPVGYVLTTTAFEGVVTARADGGETVYTVSVSVPTLSGATADDVGSAVEDDWFETLARRLEDAPKATGSAVELDGCSVERSVDTVTVEYTFRWETPSRAADIAKTFIEYVEGTYVEGIVPGYEYEPPVSDLLASASQSGDAGTPL